MISALKNTSKLSKYNADLQYNNLVRKVVRSRKHINGTTSSKFGGMMKFDLRNNIMPLLTTKRVAWNTCLEELLRFIKGRTYNNNLMEQSMNTLSQNTDQTFLEKRGLKGVDQLQNIVNLLNDPVGRYSRHLLLSAWNPKELNKMVLHPCHVISQFSVNNKDELSCMLYQQSGDIGLGVPFNIASYGFLTHLLAQHCGLKPGNFIHTISAVHLYEDHINLLQKQIAREPNPSPMLRINKKDLLNEYCLDDFDIMDYKCINDKK
jgi:thymidylate synthase